MTATIAAMAETDTNLQPEAVERTIPSRDGYALAASVFNEQRDGTVVVINSATAVPRWFYRHFAGFLVRQGWSVVTYDYRGIGDSAPKSLRGFDASMRDWALLDMAAVLDWINEELAPTRLFAIGHSFGGQALGLLDNATAVDAMVGVSAQSGYWGVQGGAEKYRAAFAVYVMIPLVSRLSGYFPWSRFVRGEDLPKGVALEWAGWCRNRNYLLDDTSLPLDRYKDFTAPVLSLSIEDDDWGTARSVDEMMRAYSSVTRRHISPADYGLDHIGHMGAFRQQAEPLWDEIVEWLERH